MKAKSKKKSKDKSPPSSPISPELKKLAPDHPDISLLDVLRNAEDTMALQVGNKPSMKELVKSAKGGDDKSFLALVKIHTFLHPFGSTENSNLIIPSVSANHDFYNQDWVQLKLKRGMEDEKFEEAFWKAVVSRQNNTLYNISATELKRYISIRKTAWEAEQTTIESILEELISKKLLPKLAYEDDLDSLRKFLNRCGLSRPAGRPQKKKIRT